MTTHQEALSAAAEILRATGAALAAQDARAASAFTPLPAAGDEVSALVATQFALHGGMYRDISAQVRAVHELITAVVANFANPAADG